MSLRIRVPLALALTACSLALASDRPRVLIDPLDARREGDQVRVSFALANGLTEEVLERIHSGVPVTFRHSVEVLLRRSVPIWFPRVVARARIETSVIYDSLTRQYDLTRTTSTRGAGGAGSTGPDREAHRTESPAEMRSWLTDLSLIPPINVSSIPASAQLRVRVESNLGRRYVMFLFPANQTVTAERKLEP